MVLTMDPSVLLGLALNDLGPLRSDCLGYTRSVVGGMFVYKIPLVECGADVKVRDDNSEKV